MSGKYLLDTNVVIALLAQESNVLEHLELAEEVFVPSIVIGELYYGAHKSNRIADNLARIDEFSMFNRILPCDSETARQYGKIKDNLRKKGKPIPENDIWIAALACQHDLTLVTRDGHMGEIDALRTECW